MSLLIGLRNSTPQTVLTDGLLNLGAVYRRFCRKNACGVKTFDTTANSVSLQQQGIYHVTAKFVASGTAAGVVSIQANLNGVAIPNEISSETITTPTTELRTLVLDFYLLVDNACLLGTNATLANVVTFTNTGVASTITASTVNVEKVV